MDRNELRRWAASKKRAALLTKLRLSYVGRHDIKALRDTASWLVSSSEYTNFTYDLTDLNQGHLAWFVAAVSGQPVSDARMYLSEIQQDEDLRCVLRAGIEQHAGEAGFDPAVRYSRRVGWYALVRATKPKIVVETGVEKGLGTMVLAAAVKRNSADGATGIVVAIDIDPSAGMLIAAPYADFIDLRISDSLIALKSLNDVDLFIHDSDHSAGHEQREFDAVEHSMAPQGIILSDNAHVTAELEHFAERTQRQFLFFGERPAKHWYAGAGIGAAFPVRSLAERLG